MTEAIKEVNKEANAVPVELGSDNIGKLLKRYALPAIIAMIASSLYNMVDSIFIGQGLGALAISGLAVTFPLMNLCSAFGSLVGAGGSTILSILLGQKNYAGANRTISNILTLNFIIGAFVTVIGLVFLDPILYFFGASDNTISYARDYMQIIMAGNIITHTYFGLNNVLRASGRPKTAMALTLFAVISNVILDPIFIFVFKLGIRGAAYATILCQLLALSYNFSQLCNYKKTLHFVKGIFRLDWRIARDSLSIGMSPFLMNFAACMVSLFINQQMLKFGGDLGVGAYGICNRITFMFVMICMGLNQGMQPIASYNYGARLYSRVKQVYWKTVLNATIVVSIGFIISVVFAKYVVMAFTHDPEMIAIAKHGLRLMNCILFIIGFQIVSTNFFQCLGMAWKAIVLSLSRQVLCLLPALYLLPLWLGVDGVWLSFPVGDIVAATVTAFMITPLLRKFNRLKDGEKISELQDMGPEKT